MNIQIWSRNGSFSQFLALRGIVAFPGAPIKLELVSEEDRNTVKTAAGFENKAFLVALRDPESRRPTVFPTFS